MSKNEHAAKPRMGRRVLRTTVRELLDEIFGAANLFRFTGVELAERSGLSKATVYRLWRKAEEWDGRDDAIPDMRLSTLFRLAKAVGMELTLVSRQLGLRAA